MGDADEGPISQWPITDDLAALRDHVTECAEKAGLSRARVIDLVLAANEAAINVLEHGGGTGTLTVRQEPDAVVVEITDHAGRLTAQHAGHGPPPNSAGRGFGLWLMHRLCDDFTIRQTPGRSQVRLRMTYAP